MEIKEIMINVAMLNRITITYGNKYIIIQLLILNDLRCARWKYLYISFIRNKTTKDLALVHVFLKRNRNSV